MQPRTPKQTFNRMLLTNTSSAWRTLSDTQRTAWNDYAAQLTYSDPLGSSYSPTGASIFVGSAIAPGNTTPAADPPTALPTYVLSVTGMSYVDPTPGPEAFTFVTDNTSPDSLVLVETSGPVSPGVTSAAAVRRWRSLPQSATNLFAARLPFTASPVSILASYKFIFPSPLTGQVIWFRFQEIFIEPFGSTAGIVNRNKQTFRFVVA